MISFKNVEPERHRPKVELDIGAQSFDNTGTVLLWYILCSPFATMDRQMKLSWLVIFLSLLAPPAAMASFELRSTEAEYRHFGLKKDSVETWEDGRRTPQDGKHFEWWYFDARLEDGTKLIIWFSDNWFYGDQDRKVALEITRPGATPIIQRRSYSDLGQFSKTAPVVRIGTHSFSGDLTEYRIKIDARELNGFGCELIFKRQAPPYRPGTGIIGGKGKEFGWLVAAPVADVSGTIEIPGQSLTVRGTGYHDHNWGNVSPVTLFDHWWWSRANIDGQAVIASRVRGTQEFAREEIATLYIADQSGIRVNAYGAKVKVMIGPESAHLDPRHTRSVPSALEFIASSGERAHYQLATDQHLLLSSDLLSYLSSLKAFWVRIMGRQPWYTRQESPLRIQLGPGAALEGRAHVDFFEFD